VPPEPQDPLVSSEDRDTLVCPDPGETVVSLVELEAWESLVELAPLDPLDPVDPLETLACPV